MKIIRISENYQMIPQNPNNPVDPNVQLQNLQNSQQALQFLTAVSEASGQVLAAIDNLSEVMGNDLALKNDVEQKINQAVMQTPAYQLASHMGLLSNPSYLQDPNKVSQMQVHLQRQIQDYSAGSSNL